MQRAHLVLGRTIGPAIMSPLRVLVPCLPLRELPNAQEVA
jgi:hypothetical protein